MTDHGFTNEPTERYFNICWDNLDTRCITAETIEYGGIEAGAKYLRNEFNSLVKKSIYGQASLFLDWVAEQINYSQIADRIYKEA